MKAGHLYIAKFPSVKDEYDVGGWEMVVNALAVGCGLNVAPAQAHKFASNYHCFMVRRFDRTNAGSVCILLRLMTTNQASGWSKMPLTGCELSGISRCSYQTWRADLILTLRNSGPGLFFNILVSNYR